MKYRGGDLLVQCLRNLGAVTSFGVPGESYLAVLDALFEAKGGMDYVTCRHEGGASFMATAYGKLTGIPGICWVTRGPGATNASIGVHCAAQDSVPMLLFVGQVARGMRGREAFQELDYRAVFSSVAKWVTEIDDASRIPEIVARAWRTALEGRPGPVVIALPEDMLTETTSTPPCLPLSSTFAAAPSDHALEAVRDSLATAQSPLIFLGGCTWSDAGRVALQEFAEASDIPVVAAFRYQDQFENTSQVFCGEAGVGMWPSVQGLVREADVILAIEARFGENSTGGYQLLNVPHPTQKLIHVHGSDRELGKIYQPNVAVHAHPNLFAEAISGMKISTRAPIEWRKAARDAYEAALDVPDQPSPVDMGAVARHLRDVLADDAILTNGAGNFAIWPGKHIPFGPKMRHLATQAGAMGYGLPAAIAAKIVQPDRQVVCFAGDGDFQMTCQELATARQAGAAPVILVVNNGIYGTIRAHQERHYPVRVFGTDMVSPNFAELAEAYGMYGARVSRTEDFPEAFATALASKTGAVLDLDVSKEALTPRQTLSEIRALAQSV